MPRAAPRLVWRWEQTPLEAWRGYTLWKPPPGDDPLPLETSPFKLPVHPLDAAEGGLYFQLGVSDRTRTREMHAVRAAQPELPVTGDRRSGVLLISDGEVVGGYIIRGSRPRQLHQIVVHSMFRGRGLGLGGRMVLEWYKRVQRPEVFTTQKMNPHGARSFLAAQRQIYLWAKEQGKEIPDVVQREIEDRAEERRLLEIIAGVEQTGMETKVI